MNSKNNIINFVSSEIVDRLTDFNENDFQEYLYNNDAYDQTLFIFQNENINGSYNCNCYKDLEIIQTYLEDIHKLIIENDINNIKINLNSIENTTVDLIIEIAYLILLNLDNVEYWSNFYNVDIGLLANIYDLLNSDFYINLNGGLNE